MQYVVSSEVVKDGGSSLVEVRLVNVSVGYGNGDLILKNLNVVFTGPGLILILGPNGAGKTTLLRTIMGLIKPLRGKVFVNGVEVTGNPKVAGRFIGYVPQLSLMTQQIKYPITVYEFLKTAYRLGGRTESDDRIKAISTFLDLNNVLSSNLWELSGGQRQRVFIARALINDPPIIVMDEPLAEIDPKGREDLANLIGMLSKRKLIIVTSHDPTYFIRYTKSILLINRHKYFYGQASDVLRSDRLAEIYGVSSTHKLGDYSFIHDFHVCCR